ncbi:hypothetical protein RHGRI_004584 [Rhododendron griersonianum]|uniref:Tyrosinase copper-binding domain-containing protein n=1 Tax=Rhododendron griersonianum TaxID=479676 RepID=A0AAV6LBJ8_9ERIC|nr:hypothetical protein RHGRI_004584 [Rhododendron griersonianum]KAG5561582.1 hypothetical protein RHGRI_004584 [Rhododendron griersonianum]
MASLPPPTTTAAPAATSSALFASPFFKKTLQVPTITRNHRYSFRVSCKLAKDNESNGEISQGKFDRRDMLIGLGGLYGAAGLVADPLALAAPISAPNINTCGAADLPAGARQTNCCPPKSTQIVDFKFPPVPNAMRVRPAAHLADTNYVAKFNKALQLMRDLPDSDPRSFKQQAAIHCAYCDGAYHQVGFPNLDLQVHGGWLFFPFHRWYLYFFERILGKLIDDPTFTMPFWNWDSPAGMKMPALYTSPKSAFYDALRDANHQPPTVIDLDYNGKDTSETDQARINSNLNVMYRQVVSSGKTPSLFMGSAYRAGDDPDPGAGSLENIPHGPVHIWCGDPNQPNLEDMGNFYSAGFDPIFFGHHSNVDRMWSIWKTLGGKRQDFTDSDWLNSSFVFYDENANLTRVQVKDCLDTTKLGYVYQDVDIPWLTTKPTPRVSSIFKKVKNAVSAISEAKAAEEVPSASVVFPGKLDKMVKVIVPRPRKSRSKKEKADEEEVLVIEGIEVSRDVFVKFDVFINDEDETTSGPHRTEFAGSFVNVPHKHKHHTKIKTRLRLGISELLEELGAEDDENVLVTLVPKSGAGDVSIDGVRIEFD